MHVGDGHGDRVLRIGDQVVVAASLSELVDGGLKIVFDIESVFWCKSYVMKILQHEQSVDGVLKILSAPREIQMHADSADGIDVCAPWLCCLCIA